MVVAALLFGAPLETDGLPRPAPVIQAAPARPAAQTAPAAAEPDEIIVQARPRNVPGDPMVQVNAKSFAVTQKIDVAFVGPVAQGYKHIVPRPARSGIHNFLYNVREPVVFLNFLLQFKPGKAMETAGRFVVNSTVGIGGLVDVAKARPFRLPRRPNGFADTLGYYGVKPGPFMFLPLVGPTTLRDLVGGGVDRLVLPLSVGTPFNKLYYSIPTGVLSMIDHRIEFDEQLNRIRNENSDPYTAAREYYLQRRQAEIDWLRGRHSTAGEPAQSLGSPAPPARPATAPAVTPAQPPETDLSPAAATPPG